MHARAPTLVTGPVVSARDHLSRVPGKRPAEWRRRPSAAGSRHADQRPLCDREWVSYMRAATTSPEPAVSAATTQMALPEAPQVRDQPREQRADGEPAIAPQPVDTDRSASPDRVGDITDHG